MPNGAFSLREASLATSWPTLVILNAVSDVLQADGGDGLVDPHGGAAVEQNTVTVGGLTVEYAALSYVNQVMNVSTDEPVINMAKALYAYAMAAEAYAG